MNFSCRKWKICKCVVKRSVASRFLFQERTWTRGPGPGPEDQDLDQRTGTRGPGPEDLDQRTSRSTGFRSELLGSSFMTNASSRAPMGVLQAV
ncbi:hypothetical protein EYF80_062652 [Liparis tanakae]|uniref:Uncharacterized protein n=1 Tax=Liparis tanakae TaxID=230148 RepID=A0A4Z2EEA4_9TELE|nr:hypothetical protein EYF80_062652 [Liparis tanakae]